ncbi:RidA family protein [Lacipirellula parvula]|uniref:RidA/YER057c/UK114 superfamily protein n=1 Tax=Lacipirellula parvula TaxID=2650471 RepID=A0A5K7X9K7_9BACT|nr:RidA family protein [Lacipirellula parvula]BBO31113.1 ridA/YER057c/UK114 superfamily protein [Lacipirellula parvula]
MESFEARFAALNLELPPAPKAIGVYKPIVEINGLLYLSGHGPLLPDGTLIKGRIGADMDVAAGYQAARQTGLAILASLKKHCGSLDRIARLVKTFGLVQATPELVDHPAVINGFSELMRDVFGEECGIAARSAVGAASLPAGMSVEIEAIFELAK